MPRVPKDFSSRVTEKETPIPAFLTSFRHEKLEGAGFHDSLSGTSATFASKQLGCCQKTVAMRPEDFHSVQRTKRDNRLRGSTSLIVGAAKPMPLC